MALSYSLFAATKPTTVSATAKSGGSLPIGVTYYYRFLGVRRYSSSVAPAISEPSVEVSATTDSTNRTIELNWTYDSPNDHVIIQRSTTSGSYPPLSGGLFSPRNLTLWNTRPYALGTITTIDDTGGTSTGDPGWEATNFDTSRAYPLIEVTGAGSSDVVTLYDIWQEDVANSWGVIERLAPADLKEVTSVGNWNYESPFVTYGSLRFNNCTFRHRGLHIMYQGAISNNTNVTFEYGNSSQRFLPYLLFYNTPQFGTTDNGTTYSSSQYIYNMADLTGSSNSYSYDYIKRQINPINSGYGGFGQGVYDDGVKTSGVLQRNIIGLNSANGMPVFGGQYDDNILESNRHNIRGGIIANTLVRYSGEGCSHRWTQETIYDSPRIIKSNTDVTWGQNLTTVAHWNPTYQSKGQTNNVPYFYLGASNSGSIGSSMYIGYTAKIKVIDTEGNPIEGATVTITDSTGYSDIWTNAGYYVTTTSFADSVTSLTVNDGSLVTVGEIIRHRTCTERMQVSSVNSNTIAVTRGVQNTTSFPSLRNEYTVDYEDTWWKQVSELTTDANGYVTPDYPLTQVNYKVARSDGSYFQQGYANSLVTSGYATQTDFTPHTLTVSKRGYQTKTIVFDLNSKIDQGVTLEKVVKYIMPEGKKMYWNLKPEDGQNKFEFTN
jgi:hypothetical protein